MIVPGAYKPDSSAAAMVNALTVDPGSITSVIARLRNTLKSVMLALL